MAGWSLYDTVLAGLFATAPAVFAALWFLPAPYGRHSRSGWGPAISARAAWLVMEAPAVFAFVAFYAAGPHALGLAPLGLLVLWQAHYAHRALVYPFRIRPSRRTPLAVVAMAIAFNVANAFVNATWLSQRGSYPAAWLADPRFVGGLLLFAAGFAVNRWADAVLRHLRAPGEGGYRVPRGGLYELVSCPNYLGEMVQWFGWALATWSLAGLSFAVFTVANLLPRAMAHHRWYRTQFADYPSERRAVVPFLW